MDHQAFAQMLGNYGEFVGAIAVVVTLAYLSVQIRQNSRTVEESVRALRLNAADSTVESFSRYRERLSRPEVAALFVKGIDDYFSLNEPERVQFGAVMDEYFFTYWSVFRRREEGTYEREDWNAHVNAIRQVLSRPGAADWWSERKSVYPPSFVSELASHGL